MSEEEIDTSLTTFDGVKIFFTSIKPRIEGDAFESIRSILVLAGVRLSGNHFHRGDTHIVNRVLTDFGIEKQVIYPRPIPFSLP